MAVGAVAFLEQMSRSWNLVQLDMVVMEEPGQENPAHLLQVKWQVDEMGKEMKNSLAYRMTSYSCCNHKMAVTFQKMASVDQRDILET